MKLRELREQRQLRASELAMRAGIATNTVYRVEIGQSVPARETALRIAYALGVPTADVDELAHVVQLDDVPGEYDMQPMRGVRMDEIDAVQVLRDLDALMKKYEVTPRELVRWSGVPDSTMYQLVSNRRRGVKPDTVQALVNVFGEPIAGILPNGGGGSEFIAKRRKEDAVSEEIIGSAPTSYEPAHEQPADMLPVRDAIKQTEHGNYWNALVQLFGGDVMIARDFRDWEQAWVDGDQVAARKQAEKFRTAMKRPALSPGHYRALKSQEKQERQERYAAQKHVTQEPVQQLVASDGNHPQLRQVLVEAVAEAVSRLILEK